MWAHCDRPIELECWSSEHHHVQSLRQGHLRCGHQFPDGQPQRQCLAYYLFSEAQKNNTNRLNYNIWEGNHIHPAAVPVKPRPTPMLKMSCSLSISVQIILHHPFMHVSDKLPSVPSDSSAPERGYRRINQYVLKMLTIFSHISGRWNHVKYPEMARKSVKTPA